MMNDILHWYLLCLTEYVLDVYFALLYHGVSITYYGIEVIIKRYDLINKVIGIGNNV